MALCQIELDLAQSFHRTCGNLRFVKHPAFREYRPDAVLFVRHGIADWHRACPHDLGHSNAGRGGGFLVGIPG